jgi:hypothetical protein
MKRLQFFMVSSYVFVFLIWILWQFFSVLQLLGLRRLQASQGELLTLCILILLFHSLDAE